MALFVVSDLHLWGKDDPLYQPFLELIRGRPQPGDTLVLAGDIFDLFVGNKPVFVDRYADFLKEIREAGQRGVRIHYIEGNHDFLLNRALRKIPNLELHPENVTLTLGEKSFFISHGDLVDSSDRIYRLSRLFFRSPVMKVLVRLLPGSFLDWVGRKSSQYSRGRKPLLPADLPVRRMEELRNKYRSFAAEKLSKGFDFVVMGHCHDLDEMSFQVRGKTGQYINVGYPRAHGSVLGWRPGEEKITREPLG